MAPSAIDGAEVRLALRAILSSRTFQGLRRLQEFLAFVVAETLAGRGDQLKEHTIGVAVYRRPLDYDTKIDAIVRVEAVKLRRTLELFYQREGAREEVRIELRKGSYVPEFTRGYYPTERDEVEELIAKGTYLLLKCDEKPTLDACSLFRRAIRADPSNVRAHNALIHALCFASGQEYLPALATMPELPVLAQSVQRLDGQDSDSQVSEMIVSTFCRRDLPAAIAAGRRALDIDPNNATAQIWAAATLVFLGKIDEAENFMRRAIRLQPRLFSLFAQAVVFYYAGELERCHDLAVELRAWEPGYWQAKVLLAQVFTARRQYDEAVHEAEAAFSVCGASMALSTLAWTYAVAGFREKAEITLQQLETMSAHRYVAPSGIAAAYAALGRTAEATAHTRAALANRDHLFTGASMDLRLAPLTKLI